MKNHNSALIKVYTAYQRASNFIYRDAYLPSHQQIIQYRGEAIRADIFFCFFVGFERGGYSNYILDEQPGISATWIESLNIPK